MILALLASCVLDAPLPYVGECAVYPSGVYEYGQIGIGTCLAGPADLQWVGDGTVLAVSNANPFAQFTGGSVLFIDFDDVDLGTGKNLVSDLSPDAVAMPSFVGDLELDEDRSLLLVADRYSAEARTREADDLVRFLDVSNPTSPVPATVGDPEVELGNAVHAGYDPSAIAYDPASGMAFVVQRTAHEITALGMTVDPVAVVDAGQDGNVTAGEFVDVDGRGSRAEFVELQSLDATLRESHGWSLRWNSASARLWHPAEGGAVRWDGNGGGDWLRSPLALDLDAGETDGVVAEVRDPSFAIDAVGAVRMVFLSGDEIRGATSTSVIASWSFDDTALLSSTPDEEVLGGPHLVTADGVSYLFYDGGDGVTQSVRVATSTDGVAFDREGVVLAGTGAESIESPYVLYDGQADRWRMWATARDGMGGVTIRQAWSEDLLSWTPLGADSPGGEAPAASYWDGAWHVFSQVPEADGWRIVEQASTDGLGLGASVGTKITVADTGTGRAPGLALQVLPEGTFRVEDDTGEVFPLSLQPGARIDSANDGFRVRVATGFELGTEDDPELTGGGASVGSALGDTLFVAVTGSDGVQRIARATAADGAASYDDVVLEPGAGGGFDVDGVEDPTVVEADDGSLVMFYAGRAGDLVRIGRAVSVDGGLTWNPGDGAVVSSSGSWDSVEMRPGSVTRLADGTWRLWYSGSDGERYRVGYAESADGLDFEVVGAAEAAWQFDGGSPGDWDDSGARDPMVLSDGETDRLWFSGYDGAGWQIGYAERTGGGAWVQSTARDGTTRPVIPITNGSFGAGSLRRPVVVAAEAGYTGWVTGFDAGQARSGRVILAEADRAWRVAAQPSIPDTWGFSSEPAVDAETIDLDGTFGDLTLSARGCAALQRDPGRGMLYVGCKLVPMVYAIDIRDDSTETFADRNFLGVEAVLYAQTTTDSDSGFRSLLYDESRDVLWGLMDDPEALYELRVDDLVDDGSVQVMRQRVLGMVALPRGSERDKGVDSSSSVGPAAMAMRPDGRHLLVTNFNDNSVVAIDLDLGPGGTIVAEAPNVGENPSAIVLTPGGRYAVVANYTGTTAPGHSASSLVVLGADPSAADWMLPITWVENQ